MWTALLLLSWMTYACGFLVWFFSLGVSILIFYLWVYDQRYVAVSTKALASWLYLTMVLVLFILAFVTGLRGGIPLESLSSWASWRYLVNCAGLLLLLAFSLWDAPWLQHLPKATILAEIKPLLVTFSPLGRFFAYSGEFLTKYPGQGSVIHYFFTLVLPCIQWCAALLGILGQGDLRLGLLTMPLLLCSWLYTLGWSLFLEYARDQALSFWAVFHVYSLDTQQRLNLDTFVTMAQPAPVFYVLSDNGKSLGLAETALHRFMPDWELAIYSYASLNKYQGSLIFYLRCFLRLSLWLTLWVQLNNPADTQEGGFWSMLRRQPPALPPRRHYATWDGLTVKKAAVKASSGHIPHSVEQTFARTEPSLFDQGYMPPHKIIYALDESTGQYVLSRFILTHSVPFWWKGNYHRLADQDYVGESKPQYILVLDTPVWIHRSWVKNVADKVTFYVREHKDILDYLAKQHPKVPLAELTPRDEENL